MEDGREGVMGHISHNKWDAQQHPALVTAIVLPGRRTSDIRYSSHFTLRGLISPTRHRCRYFAEEMIAPGHNISLGSFRTVGL